MFRLLRAISGKFEEFWFFYRNVFACRGLESIQVGVSGDFILRGADISDCEGIEDIYKKLNGAELSSFSKGLLRCCPKKTIIILEKEVEGKKNIIGIDLFYMNFRDFREKTVHEGFVGVMPGYEGQGLATRMRKHAIDHFSRTGSRGISTRISKSNLSSLRSAEKLGFQAIEEYFDPNMCEDRYYLIFRFENTYDK